MIKSLSENKTGLTVGVDHDNYSHSTPIHAGTINSLIADFVDQPRLVLS